ncbi:LPXTG cell wall anchor domain-containing protein [Streptomyces sp. 5-10]|uniref:LPXTG cell wall anchor domain-containing protein n=1 Tax=Streptomyces sp. 5-10 TaxID=878925 RepID=UPI00168A6008|nr:LPXTG cell wall anchor domain-containing protein [Streptomyces sp. 5-10]MBD3004547.1 LPXTG cell wall anchor domain-containing protein [Streptomyces sp. 5-10]
MSKKNLTRAAAVFGAAAVIAGPLTAASASATELPPYDCAVALPLLDQENPILLGALGCKDNTEKFTAEHAGSGDESGGGPDSGVEVPDVPDVPDLPGLPGGDDQGDGGDQTPAPGDETPTPQPGDDGGDQGEETPAPTPDPTDQSDQGDNGQGEDGPGKSEHAPGHDGDKGDEGNKGNKGNKGQDTLELAGSEAGKGQLAQTGGDDSTGPMLAAAGGLIALGAGAVAFKRRRDADA